MQSSNSHIEVIKTSKNLQSTDPQITYERYLNEYELPLMEDSHFLFVGVPKCTQGWKLHISVVITEIENMLKKVIPIVVKYQCPFKLIKNNDLHEQINLGDHGLSNVGKVLTILLDNETIIAPLTLELKEITGSFEGPQVVNNYYIGKNIYARYGTFIPFVQNDSYGNNILLLKDVTGQLYEDDIDVPPFTPNGVTNPFTGIADRAPNHGSTKVLANKYIITKLIRAGLKGNVYKAFYFNKFLFPKWCVIKEGRPGIFSDKYGRDIRDRFKAQSEVTRNLHLHASIPKLIEYIDKKENSFFITEYIPKALNLNLTVIKLLKHIPWIYQEENSKIDALELLNKAIEILSKIHEAGYIHRDFTDNNILVLPDKTLKVIDFELSTSLISGLPSPPFGTGTPGFISPKQLNNDHPEIADDIYSVGGLLILIVSGGTEPPYIADINDDLVKSRLLFLTGDIKLTHLIMECRSLEPRSRPPLDEISAEIKKIEVRKSNNSQSTLITDNQFSSLIDEGIYTLGTDFFTHKGIWYSRLDNPGNWDAYPLGNFHTHSNVHQGASGIIYCLSCLRASGFDITPTETNLNTAVRFVLEDLAKRRESMSESLYYGKSGIALMLGKLISSGQVAKESTSLQLIESLYTHPSEYCDVIYGIAGQGLSLLHQNNVLNEAHIKELHEAYSGTLTFKQLKNGSWNQDGNTNKVVAKNGFGYGVAGIAYYQLLYGKQYNNWDAINSGLKALNYLSKNKRNKDSHFEWHNSNVDKGSSGWWCTGSPGIALTFLKAYEVTRERRYLDIAQKALMYHPKYFIHHKLGQCHGLTGIGEIYLEAYKITNDSQWLDRARWIGDAIYHLKRNNEAGNVFWLTERHKDPSPSFMTGDSGLLHFLARLIKPNLLNFPIIN